MTVLKGLTSLAAIAAFSVPCVVLAQEPPEEIIVTGRYDRVPDNVQSLSQSVSYADLDLSTKAGRDEMKRRVSLTARFLCDKMGESASSSPIAPSCRDAATRDAMSRLGTLEAPAAPRVTTWVQPPAWAPPYPTEWSTTYP